MSSSIAWKISLPAAAPRAAPTQEAVAETRLPPSEERRVAEEAISGWVSAGDVVIMKDRDLSILAEETTALKTSASQDAGIWQAFPNAASISDAEQLIAGFVTALEREAMASAKSRSVINMIGLDWNGSARSNTDKAEDTLIRYLNATSNIDQLCEAIQSWLGVPVTMRDAAFLIGISASLKSADVIAIGNSIATREEVRSAQAGLDKLGRLGSGLQEEFGFDPAQHSHAAFGGLLRAFASKRASDFLTAAKKLGIVIKGPDQAQRAATLLKDYIAAQTELLSRPDGSRRPDDFMDSLTARARLAQSIQRRIEILGFDSALISPKIADIDLQNFNGFPGHQVFDFYADTRRLIDDNLDITDRSTPVAALSAELRRQAEELAVCTERLRRGLLHATPESTHDDIEAALKKHPEPVTGENGHVLKNSADMETLQRHVQWLLDASMLPLSDDQLEAFLAYAAA
jgi:hypothetical protein